MEFRIEKDSMGTVEVPESALWGAQTQRSLQNFKIGTERLPTELVHALIRVKRAAATVNCEKSKLTGEKCAAIHAVCDELLSGDFSDMFPLSVWQTGSGTQSNMNVNEVIARMATLNGTVLHANDDVNMSQSTNDAFPTAMHIAAVLEIETGLLPSLHSMTATFEGIEKQYVNMIKVGRTHVMDATPLLFSQEVSAWRVMIIESVAQVDYALGALRKLAIGGTAVGTGLNTPEGYAESMCTELTRLTGTEFIPSDNKFHALSSKDALSFAHGALRTLSANLLKIANDVRLLASGPRCGLGEISIPENEPGSSIMPGKVNPTQCEAMSMVCLQVMGNDTSIGFAASQGHFQLNAYMPLIAYSFLQSVRLLSDACRSFNDNCLCGLMPNDSKMAENLERSLMPVTKLAPVIGYEQAAKIAKEALKEDLSLREAVMRSGLLDEAELERLLDPQHMV